MGIIIISVAQDCSEDKIIHKCKAMNAHDLTAVSWGAMPTGLFHRGPVECSLGWEAEPWSARQLPAPPLANSMAGPLCRQ